MIVCTLLGMPSPIDFSFMLDLSETFIAKFHYDVYSFVLYPTIEISDNVRAIRTYTQCRESLHFL